MKNTGTRQLISFHIISRTPPSSNARTLVSPIAPALLPRKEFFHAVRLSTEAKILLLLSSASRGMALTMLNGVAQVMTSVLFLRLEEFNDDVCKCGYKFTKPSKFCPNCGTKRGE